MEAGPIVKKLPPPWPDGYPDLIPTGEPRGWKRARLAADGEVHVAALYSDESVDLWSETGKAFCHMGGNPMQPGHLQHCKCGLRVWDSKGKLNDDLSCGVCASVAPVAVLCAVSWKPPSVSEERCRRVASTSLVGVSVRKYCLLCAEEGVTGFNHGRLLGKGTYELWGVCDSCRDASWISIKEAAGSLGVPIVVDPWLP
ncbi:MAG: hypothetical protein ABFR89_07930 [Actinomycetota bacterium]